MSNFMRTLMLGIGIGIGLLIAPRKGEETRRLLNERWQNMRASLAENQPRRRYGEILSERGSQAAGTLKDVAEKAEQSKRAGTVTGTTYAPSYPEYVNPEKKPKV